MRTTNHPTPDMRQLAKLIGDRERVAMLTTVAPEGLVESRPMRLLDFDADGALWMFIEHRPQDAASRERHRCVNLAFSDEVSATYISVPGRGQILHDPDLKHALWTASLRRLHPDGPASPRLALLKIMPSRADYWEGTDSRTVPGLSLDVSAVHAPLDRPGYGRE